MKIIFYMAIWLSLLCASAAAIPCVNTPQGCMQADYFIQDIMINGSSFLSRDQIVEQEECWNFDPERNYTRQDTIELYPGGVFIVSSLVTVMPSQEFCNHSCIVPLWLRMCESLP